MILTRQGENEYNKEPVHTCKKCLSLNVRQVEDIPNTEYCDDCGSTDIIEMNIFDWDAVYTEKYGKPFLMQKK